MRKRRVRELGNLDKVYREEEESCDLSLSLFERKVYDFYYYYYFYKIVVVSMCVVFILY